MGTAGRLQFGMLGLMIYPYFMFRSCITNSCLGLSILGMPGPDVSSCRKRSPHVEPSKVKLD